MKIRDLQLGITSIELHMKVKLDAVAVIMNHFG